MKETQLIIWFLQTLQYRDDLEDKIYKKLRKAQGKQLPLVELNNIIGPNVQSEFIFSIKQILQNFGVISIEDTTYTVDETNLNSFIKMVAIAKYSRDYKWPINRVQPSLYISPPNIISGDLSSEIDDISNLLTNLVSSATKSIAIMSPFTNKTGLNSILKPLKSCKSLPTLTIYLNAQSSDQPMIVEQLKNLVPYTMRDKMMVYFCTSESIDGDYLPHAKLLVVDTKRGYLGSANFTKQGLTSRFEVGVELNEEQSKSIEKLLKKLEEKGIYKRYC